MQRLALFGISVLIGLGILLFRFELEKKNGPALNAVALQQQVRAADEENHFLREQVKLLRDSDTRRIALTDGSNKANAFLYYNSLLKKIALDISTIPAPPAGKQFWLWGKRGTTYEIIGPIPQQAISSWHPLTFLPNLDSFMVAEGTNEVPTSSIPNIVVLTSEINE